MARNPIEVGPKLETLLDERDHVRIKINLAESDPSVLPENFHVLRQRLLMLDREILKQWETPDA